jgi:hypothetical protein
MAQRLTLILTLLVVTSACERRAPSDGDNVPARSADTMSDGAQASATVAAMLALAEEGRWAAYVDEYYGEAHKFDSPDDRIALVERFEQQWGTRAIEGLQQAASVAPVIDEEGRAVFTVDGRPVFVLYKSDDGRWTFHL